MQVTEEEARQLLPITLVIHGVSSSKKNSQQIVFGRGNRLMVVPGKHYKQFRDTAMPQLQAQWEGRTPIPRTLPINAQIITYSRRRIGDASNFYQGPEDMLQCCGILENDSCIVSHDGSRKKVDKNNPRVEITLSVAEGSLWET